MTKPKPEQVYLIHIWAVEEGGKLVWRASLESVWSGERQVFASLEDLFSFIKIQMQTFSERAAEENRPVDSETGNG